MIARLQQLITLGLLGAGFTLFVVLWHHGHPWAGAAIALSGLFGHSVILGIEFIAMRRVNLQAPDSTPFPTLGELMAAWLRESRHAPIVFCWRQPFRSRRVADLTPTTPHAQSRPGVLLVHGYVCNRGIWNPWLCRLRSMGAPFIAPTLEPPFGGIDDYVSSIEANVRQLERATGCAPLVVAHSMGGLAVLKWWSQPGNSARIAHFISIGTPYHGTWLARFAMSLNARQMRQGSPWLRQLHAALTPDLTARTTCFYSNADNIVFPVASATLPGADHRLLHGIPHVAMVDDPRTWAELHRRLHA